MRVCQTRIQLNVQPFCTYSLTVACTHEVGWRGHLALPTYTTSQLCYRFLLPCLPLSVCNCIHVRAQLMTLGNPAIKLAQQCAVRLSAKASAGVSLWCITDIYQRSLPGAYRQQMVNAAWHPGGRPTCLGRHLPQQSRVGASDYAVCVPKAPLGYVGPARHW